MVFSQSLKRYLENQLFFVSVNLALLVIIFILFILTPLDADQKVNLAFAQQADLMGDFPQNISEAWTLRVIGYKYLIYLFYKGTSLIVDYNNKVWFEIAFKFLYGISIISFIVLSVLVCKNFFKDHKISAWDVFFVCCFGFLSISHWSAFQPEDISGLILVLSTGLSLSKNKYLNYCSGLVSSLLLTTKGISGILSFCTIILLFSLGKNYRNNLRIFLVSWLISSCLVISWLVFLIPSEIQDLRDAVVFQGSFKPPLKYRITQFTVNLIKQSAHNPILIPGIISSVFLVYKFALSRKVQPLICLIIAWLIPILYIVVQAKFFGYHYSVLVPLSIGSIILLITNLNQVRNPDFFKAGIYGFILIALIIGTSPVAPNFGNYYSVKKYNNMLSFIKDWNQPFLDEYQKLIEEIPDLSEQPSILYLSDGTATYFLQSKSYLRYFYPLPLQRTIMRSDVILDKNLLQSSSSIFKSQLDKTLNYEGKYIILNPKWFDLAKIPILEKKITSQYQKIYEFTHKNDLRRTIQIWVANTKYSNQE